MPNQAIALIVEYHLPIMIGVLALLILAGRKKPGNRMLLILTLTLAGSITYEIVMDEPVSQVAVRINQALNQPGPTESTNPHYYTPPEERNDDSEILKDLPTK